MHLFIFKLGLLTSVIAFAQTSTPPISAGPVQPIQAVQQVPTQQPIQAQTQPQIPAQAPVQPIQQIQPAVPPVAPAQPQPVALQPVAPPQQYAQPNAPQPQLPTGTPLNNAAAPQPAAPKPAAPQPVQAPRPLQVAPVPTTGDSKLPADFEFISISPYYKNKPRLGKLTATVVSTTNEVLGTVTGDFGDCKTCIRGASIKGKLGIRFYGQSLRALTVSRKQSSSIQIEGCPTNVLLTQDSFSCDFVSGGVKMKLNMRIEP